MGTTAFGGGGVAVWGALHLIVGLGLWCLTIHSTIFQLLVYHGGQFYW
jgi:uncharacterized membrane protein (DUF2068 family)